MLNHLPSISILIPSIFLMFAAPGTGRAAQHVIIRGAIEKTDQQEQSDLVDVHRLPLLAGDFIAIALISEDSYPTLKQRFQPKSRKLDAEPPWVECHGSHGLLQGTDARRFVATPDKGPSVPFTLRPPYETLLFHADEDGILELKISCSKESPYFFIMGKDKFRPEPEVIVTGEIQPDDPVFASDSRYRDHKLPPVETGSFMFDVRQTGVKTPISCAFVFYAPGGGSLIYHLSIGTHHIPLPIGRLEAGDYVVRVQAIASQAKLNKPMPYEIVRWRIPDLFKLMGIEPEKVKNGNR